MRRGIASGVFSIVATRAELVAYWLKRATNTRATAERYALRSHRGIELRAKAFTYEQCARELEDWTERRRTKK